MDGLRHCFIGDPSECSDGMWDRHPESIHPCHGPLPNNLQPRSLKCCLFRVWDLGCRVAYGFIVCFLVLGFILLGLMVLGLDF